MKIFRKIIEIDDELCDGCGLCMAGCAEGALKIVDGKAKVISDNLCDGLGACMGECPQNALRIVEKETEEFDEKAVEKHLARIQPDEAEKTLPCGCPSTQTEIFDAPNSCPGAASSRDVKASESALAHWPVKIRLIPATAPFLKRADLLVMADCVPVARPDVHNNLLKRKAVMIGCPKFDDLDGHMEKFADIFLNADIKSVTCAIMEVPCCSSLPAAIKKGMEKAGINIPIKEMVIGKRGGTISLQML